MRRRIEEASPLVDNSRQTVEATHGKRPAGSVRAVQMIASLYHFAEPADVVTSIVSIVLFFSSGAITMVMQPLMAHTFSANGSSNLIQTGQDIFILLGGGLGSAM